ncbi:MAG: hypothetical protein WD970_00205 [Patescibacteria group bacterium]
MPVEHDHASVSLKVLLLFFSVLLVGALGYFTWNYLNTVGTDDNSSMVVADNKSSSEEIVAETDPCDFSTATTTVKQGVTFDTMGEENFSTLVCGYLISKEGDVGFDEPDIRTLAYIAVTKFKDAGFETKIKAGITEGNTVNATQDGAYLLGCGCLESGALTVNPGPADWIEPADQTKLLASTKDKPVIIKLTYEVHGGSGCSCCSLFEKAEVL